LANPTYALPRWWKSVRDLPPDKIAKAWDAMTPAEQVALAGDRRAAMETVVNVFRGKPPPGVSDLATAGIGSPAGHGLGHPALGATVGTIPTIVEQGSRIVPYYLAPRLLDPQALPALIQGFPKVMTVGGPLVVRGATQAYTAAEAPPARLYIPEEER